MIKNTQFWFNEFLKNIWESHCRIDINIYFNKPFLAILFVLFAFNSTKCHIPNFPIVVIEIPKLEFLFNKLSFSFFKLLVYNI